MKYKVGDKVVMKIISADQDEIKTYSVSGVNDDWRWCLPQNLLERYTEPLSTYTEPLSNKVADQRKEINHLLRKIKEKEAVIERLEDELRSRAQKLTWQKGVEAGQNEAWSLCNEICKRRKVNEIQDMFNHLGINEFCQLFDRPYSEIAEKFAQWEKAKEEIKVGDIYKNIAGSCFVICDVNGEDNNAQVLWSSSLSSRKTLDEIKRYYTKTGRHIDIDSFLKQIGGEE